MADLFGDWVSDEWIDKVFKACFNAPQHRYLFLTKNPERYDEYFLDDNEGHYQKYVSKYFPDGWQIDNYHIMLGATVTNNQDLQKCDKINYIDFLSIEPLLEDIECETLFSAPTAYSSEEVKKYAWIIIGAESGSRKDKIIPKREWVENIVTECRAYGIPVFMKSSLAGIWGEPLIQEYPWKGITI